MTSQLQAYDVNFRVENFDLKSIASIAPGKPDVRVVTAWAFEQNKLPKAMANGPGPRHASDNLCHTYAALKKMAEDSRRDTSNAMKLLSACMAVWTKIVTEYAAAHPLRAAVPSAQPDSEVVVSHNTLQESDFATRCGSPSRRSPSASRTCRCRSTPARARFWACG